MSTSESSDPYAQGYDAMLQWARGRSTASLRSALAERTASIDGTHPYNRGGNAALRDLLAEAAEA